MKGFFSGLLIGVLIALFSWWLQNREPELRWTVTQTRFDPAASSSSEFSRMAMYSARIVNNGRATAEKVNIEISLPQGAFVTANIDVPERSSVTKWTEITKSTPVNALNLQYGRLLPDDSIQIGALFKSDPEQVPTITVRSDRVSGVSQETVDERQKKREKVIDIVVSICAIASPFLALLSMRSKLGQRTAELVSLPVAPLLAWFMGKDIGSTLRARQLMRKARYRDAIKVLERSDEAYDRYLLARCYSKERAPDALATALTGWLKGLQREYVDDEADFDYLRQLPLSGVLRERLSVGLESPNKTDARDGQ